MKILICDDDRSSAEELKALCLAYSIMPAVLPVYDASARTPARHSGCARTSARGCAAFAASTALSRRFA